MRVGGCVSVCGGVLSEYKEAVGSGEVEQPVAVVHRVTCLRGWGWLGVKCGGVEDWYAEQPVRVVHQHHLHTRAHTHSRRARTHTHTQQTPSHAAYLGVLPRVEGVQEEAVGDVQRVDGPRLELGKVGLLQVGRAAVPRKLACRQGEQAGCSLGTAVRLPLPGGRLSVSCMRPKHVQPARGGA